MPKRKEESLIQDDLIVLMEGRNWLVEPTHGNLIQKGFPDLWCHHVKYGYRWIDVKRAHDYDFTKWQKRKWPNWEEHGVMIWILTAATEDEYAKLFKAPNWRQYWKPSYGVLPDIPELLRLLNEAPDQIKSVGMLTGGVSDGDGPTSKPAARAPRARWLKHCR